MKFYNIPVALALLFAPVQTHAKQNTGASDYEQEATNGAPLDRDQEGITKRYIVKYKKGSSDYKARFENAKNDAKRSKGNGGQGNGNNDRGNGQGNQGKMRNSPVSSPPVQERGGGMLKFGKFLPRANAEVIYLDKANERKYRKRDDVEYVELDQKVYLMNEEIPYGIEKVQALQVPDTDVSDRKVCIIDTGFDINHPDLTSDPNIVTGYDGQYSSGPGDWFYDGHGHGTHVAGTIAAIGGNGEGVVGVNRNGQLKLHIVKIFGNDGVWAWGSSVAYAAELCVEAQANVISMSLGGGAFSQAASDTYDSILYDDNVLLVAAAGNDGNTAYSYPASYDSVMSVAATDSNNDVAGFSQKNDQVDIAAPGVFIKSTLPSHVSSSGYASWSGTSMATPHVSGIAALIWSRDTTRSAVEIRQALQESAQDLGVPGRDNSYGHGLVRADLAAAYLDSGFTVSPTAAPTPAPPCTDEPEGWYDIDGPTYNCAWYAQGTNCAAYGDSYANNGITANMACCACGGGVPDGPPATAAPTASPTTLSPTPPPTCGDEPNWHDSDGITFNCEWYAQKTNCAVYGDNYENNGKTANAACCVCGGGLDTPSPTAEPTASPTIAATQCTDEPEGWHDIDGATYDCEWYSNGSNCAYFGDGYANNGVTANMACCACGGGTFA